MGLTLSTSGGANGSNPQPLTITIPANAAVCLLASFNAGSGQSYFQGSVADAGPGGNTYVAAGGTNSAQANGQYDDAFYCLNTTSSATSITYTPSASYTSMGNVGISVWVWTASGGTVTFGSVIDNAQTSAVGTGTDAITSTAVTCSTGSVVMGLTRDIDSGPVSVGTGFTSDYNGFNILIGEHGAFSSNHAATWTTATGTDARILSQALSFGFSPTSVVYDGTTASGTVVSTGTGGTALPAFNVGDCIHVLLMAQTASALTITSNPSDGHNTYVNLQNADNHGTTGFIWARWTTMVTTAITTPVISATWSGTAKLAIAVAKLSNINTGAPNVTGGNAQSNQTTPSGSNAQTSGLTISPNLLVPVTLGGWGFSVNESGAPAAGAGFSQIGTAWAALGSACLTYETMTSNAAIQQTATFTPIGGTNTFTALDVFNQIGSHPPTVPASGPMPRQIYVMP